MSQETSQWLNSKTLIGFTENRGQAWHWRASDQGAESNHYVGAIPIEDVRRRLFGWNAVEGDVSTTVLLPDSVLTLKDPERKTIVRPPGALGPEDPGGILGIFKSGYTIHQYEEWLLGEVANILDSGLDIGSAGLLKEGAVAWVSVETPDTITTPEGVEFKPFISAATSLDGSMSTTYGKHVQAIVCDNTMAVGFGEAAKSGERVKIKHSRYSKLKLTEVRSALNIIHTISEDFSAEVARLTSVKVSDGDFVRFLDSLHPVPEDEGRARTLATNKREGLTTLWRHDARVAPWKNTAFGVVQAVNTWSQHHASVRGTDRVERNALRVIDGSVDKLDASTLKVLEISQR